MKKILLILIFSLLVIDAYADNNAVQAIQNLSKYSRTASSEADKLALLKQLGGDTISFEFPNTYLDNFTKEIPDTLWIKKRPKKNPVEGKHYTLSYIYKGELVGDQFTTPSYVINGKKFGVLSADSKSEGSYYISKTDYYILKLVDLDDLSIVECKIPDGIPYDVTIYSNKVDRLISNLIDSKIYINTGSAYSPKYKKATLSDASYKLLFHKTGSIKKLESILDLKFISANGEKIPFTFERDSYSSYSSNAKKIISEEEYNSNYVKRTISSEIDLDIADADVEKPFSFSYIIGVPKSSIARISQTIDPSEVKSYSWTSNYKYAPEDVMFVAGTETVKGVQFYKMVYNAKAFFMKASDVNLTSEDSAKLDSLNNSSQEVKNYFFHNTLALSRVIYRDKLQKTINEFESFKKYGLAIENWGVYDESEYIDGTGVNISFYNPTQQMIKYISFSFQGYNAVDDPYGRTITRRCIGPINPDETASYQFEYVWFTDIVEYAKLRSITVTYKNGTTKTISNPNAIIFSDELRKELNSLNPVETFN